VALNDVWRTIGTEVGFFYEANFDQIPSAPGVYAWFYPLRILSRSPGALQQLVGEAQALLNFDSSMNGVPRLEAEIPVAWWKWVIAAGRSPKEIELSEFLSRAWTEVYTSDELFGDFQKTLLKSSIFMPPLYVGKADNLNTRCGQHLRGADGANDFHRRYEGFAKHLNLRVRSVRDLIFACVRTGIAAEHDPTQEPSPVHELVECVMKGICAPPYGMR
jgi:hypothetical protein